MAFDVYPIEGPDDDADGLCVDDASPDCATTRHAERERERERERLAATAPAAPLVGALAPIAPLAPLSAAQLQAIRNTPRSSQSDSEDAYSEYAEDLGVEPNYRRLLLSRAVVGRRE